jgi:hypothetical protein
MPAFQFSAPLVQDDALDALTSKISALFRKAASSEFPNEKAAFEAKALSMMNKHRIDRAQIDDGSDEIVDLFLGEWASTYALSAAYIASAIGDAYGCKFYFKQRRGIYYTFALGYRSDAERVRRLIATLIPQAIFEASKLNATANHAAVSVRRSFLMGFASGVAKRFKEAADLASADDSAERGESASFSTALVFVARAEAVNAVQESRDTRTRKQSDSVIVSSAYGAGFKSGRESGRASLAA